MTPIQLQCLDLIKAGLFGYPLFLRENINWYSVYAEMKNQNIIGIPNHLLPDMPLTEDLLERWTNSILFQINHSFTILEAQSEISSLFKRHFIPFAVLKGISNVVNYPQLESRQLGDIDLLVPEEYFDTAVSILKDADYVVIDSNDPRHLVFEKDKVELELHRYFSYVQDGMGKKFDMHLLESMSSQQVVNIEGYEFDILPTTDCGLIILMHINENLKRGIKLRHILDFVTFVNKNVDDEYWSTVFEETVDLYNLKQLAKIVARCGQIFCGLSNNISWCKTVDESLCESFIEYVFQSESVFMKNDLNSSFARVLMNSKQSGSFFKNLQISGSYNWKALEKHPRLKPFAWMYQLCRYTKKIIQRIKQGDEISLRENNYQKQVKLLKSFGVTQLPDD